MSDYKELPCRRCGRVWKWAMDKKSVPYCPEGYGCTAEPEPTTKELFDKIMKRLDDIEMKIKSIPPVYPVQPVDPDPNYWAQTICKKCGMNWSGVMGYVCGTYECPMQFKASWQSYNISTSTGEKE